MQCYHNRYCISEKTRIAPLACVMLIAPVADSVVATCQCLPNGTLSELIIQIHSAEMCVTDSCQWANDTWFDCTLSMLAKRQIVIVNFKERFGRDVCYRSVTKPQLSVTGCIVGHHDCELRDVSRIKKKMCWHLLSLRI